MKILHYGTVQSTNSTAYQLAERGAEQWTIIVADRQTKGRGRSGRRWVSPKGGLWFSTILRPKISVVKLPLLQFMAANAARRALEEETDLKTFVKWPNDLVLQTGKIGGILIESKTIDAQVVFAVIGTGLNINLTAQQLPVGATSAYRETRKRLDNQRLLQGVIDQMSRQYATMRKPKAIVSQWWNHCIHRPSRVEVSHHEKRVTGITRGLEEDGSLTLMTDQHEIVRVSDGSLRLLD